MKIFHESSGGIKGVVRLKFVKLIPISHGNRVFMTILSVMRHHFKKYQIIL